MAEYAKALVLSKCPPFKGEQMYLKLDFNVHFYPAFRHPISEIFSLNERRQDLVLDANATNKLELRFFTGLYFNDYADITGWKIYFTVKDNPTEADSAAILKIDTTTFSDPKEGKAEINIPYMSGGVLEGNFIYSIKAKLPSGKIRSLCYGCITFMNGEIGTRVN
jgi:hypothetical protein